MVDLKSMYPNVLWVHCRVMNITVLNCQRNVAAAACAAAASVVAASVAAYATAAAGCRCSRRL